MEVISCVPVAMRASPPGSTRQAPGPSDTAKTRSMTERGAMLRPPVALRQVGICESGW